jgi:hypothetical protein
VSEFRDLCFFVRYVCSQRIDGSCSDIGRKAKASATVFATIRRFKLRYTGMKCLRMDALDSRKAKGPTHLRYRLNRVHNRWRLAVACGWPGISRFEAGLNLFAILVRAPFLQCSRIRPPDLRDMILRKSWGCGVRWRRMNGTRNELSQNPPSVLAIVSRLSSLPRRSRRVSHCFSIRFELAEFVTSGRSTLTRQSTKRAAFSSCCCDGF